MPGTLEYIHPTTPGQALELLSRPGRTATPWLVSPKPIDPRRMEADVLVDLGGLNLDYFLPEPDGSLHIGSLATLSAIQESISLKGSARELLQLSARIAATPGIRNLASLWGCLQARNGPPEVQLALEALDAQLVFLRLDGSQHQITVAEFLAGEPDTFQDAELLLEAILPPQASSGWALERVARTPRDEAIVAAAACVEVVDGKASWVSLALAGAHPRPLRLHELEKSFAGQSLDRRLLRATAQQVQLLAEPVGDFRAGGEYRRSMAGLVVRRALEKAWHMAVEGGAE